MLNFLEESNKFAELDCDFACPIVLFPLLQVKCVDCEAVDVCDLSKDQEDGPKEDEKEQLQALVTTGCATS